MVNHELEKEINALVNECVNEALDWVEMASEPMKFKKARTKILDVFGDRGMKPKLQKLLEATDWNGVGGNIHTGEEVS